MRRPTFFNTCSLTDLFYERVSVSRINRIFDAMSAVPRHRFQVITKRTARALEIAARLRWPDNLVLGASVESQDYGHRLDALRHLPARVKFACFEPLLGPVPSVDISGMDSVVVGGEFGPRWRPIDLAWVRNIRDASRSSGIPFYFSQVGGRGKSRTGRAPGGDEWVELPRGLWAPGARAAVLPSDA